MEKTVLLISRTGDETNRLEKELRENLPYRVVVASTPEQAIAEVTRQVQKSEIVIFNTEVFNLKRLQIVSNLRVVGKGFPVLVLTDMILPNMVNEIEKSSKTVMLEKPFDMKDLFGITEKFIEGELVQQQIFRRYFTNEVAVFSRSPHWENQFDIRILNLSQGGAFLECASAETVKPGDWVELKIKLSKVNRKYNVLAKVVWTRALPTQQTAVGVQFMKV